MREGEKNERARLLFDHDAFHGRRFDVGAVDLVVFLFLAASESRMAKRQESATGVDIATTALFFSADGDD